MAMGCSDISELAVSATKNSGTLDERMAGAKVGRSKVNLGASEFCAQCSEHSCRPGEPCSVQGSPAVICISCSAGWGGGNTSEIRQPATATLTWMNSSANKTTHETFCFDDADKRQNVDELLIGRFVTLFHWAVKSLNYLIFYESV